MTSSSSNAYRMVILWTALMAFGYLLQLLTPLRISVDSYRHLAMAISAANGDGFLVDGQPDRQPIGYALILLGLLKMGLANPAVFVAINIVSIAAAALVFRHILSTAGFTRFVTALVIATALSSWVLIKFVTVPQSDVLYLGISSLSLLGLWRFWKNSGAFRWAWFLGAAFMAALSIMVRTCGLALLPTLVLTALLHRDNTRDGRRVVDRFGKGALTTFIVVGLVMGIAALFALSRSSWCDVQLVGSNSYLQKLLARFGRLGVLSLVTTGLRYRALEFGEVFLNLPVNKVPQLTALFFVSGIAGWIVAFRGCWLTRSRLVPLNLYFVFYAAMMLCWPAQSIRFWLPLIPIVMTFTIAALPSLCTRGKGLRIACGAYLAGFLALGLVAMLFSTRISMSGKDFSERYGTGSATMTYRYAFDTGKPVTLEEVNPAHVKVLNVFDPRASKTVNDLANDTHDTKTH